MRVRLSLTGATETTDVVLEAPSGTTLAQVLPTLSRACGEPIAALSQAGIELDQDAVLGLPPLLDGASLRRHREAPPVPRSTPRPSGAIHAAVISGPDAGHEITLSPGSERIGRSPGAELTIEDPGVSREHCRLEVTSDGIHVQTLPTTNPTIVESPSGERHVVSDRMSLGGTDRLRLGASVVALRTGRVRPARVTTPGDGSLLVHRVPRDMPAWSPVTLREPTAPNQPAPSRFPWLTMLLPIPVCAVMAWFWGPQMLAFALLGPLLTGGNAVHDRISMRKQHRAAQQTHAIELAEHHGRIAAALAAQRRRLEHLHPDPAAVLGAARDRTTRLWERTGTSADLLAVRLGRGPVAASLTVVSAAPEGPGEPLYLSDAPVVVDLAQVGPLGVEGDTDAVVRMGRLLIGQVASLAVPRSLCLWTLGADADWAWTDLLPHVKGAGQPPRDVVETLSHLVAERTTNQPRPRASDRHEPVHLLIVPNAAAARALPGFADLLEAGPSVSVHAIVLDSDGSGLPAECRSTVTVTGHGSESSLRDPHGEVHSLTADGVGQWWSEQLSRALAPLREANVASDAVPDRVRLSDIVPSDVTTVLEQWQRRTGPRAVVGATASDAYAIDLLEDGPHALIGGTTGSGKSELLRALVAGLAAGSAPEDVSLVLIDYKGGSAFRDLQGLPHVTGIVTDLDPALADRALRSLDAEIRRRERLLAAADCPDLATYQASAHHDLEPLPRLVIVIDELRMLVDELPDFVSGLVRLASVGRSLGIHLVLATQRPAGAVTPDIAANVNLRIALRVRDRVDSESIIESAAAADIDEALPGRALASTGTTVVEFHSALVSAEAADEHVVRVHLGPHVFERPTLGASLAPTANPLVSFVGMVSAAAAAAGSARVSPPWLDPLPDTMSAEGLANWGDLAPTAVPWGLIDRPDEQAIEPLLWDAATPEHLALIGASASGRTTALITLAAAAALGGRPIHLHALDGQGRLADLQALPVTGSVVRLDDRARVRRLLTMLSGECQRRRDELTRRGFASVADWQASGEAEAPPTLMLLVDGWDTLVNPGLGDFETHALGQDLIALLRNGISAGLRCVAAGGQALSGGSGAANFARKIALGTLELPDAALLGLRGKSASQRPAGHGVEARSGDALLVAHLGDAPTREAQRLALTAAAIRCAPPREVPRTLAALPSTLTGSELAALTSSTAPDAGATLWVGVDEDLQPAGFTPSIEGRHLLVAGSRRSGRTTALATLATAIATSGAPAVWIRSMRAPADGCPAISGLSMLSADQSDDLIALRRAHPNLAVIVDDADLLSGTAMERVLLDIDAAVDRANGLLVCAGDTATLSTAYRGLCVDVAARRTGLLLGAATRADGDIFGARVDLGERLPGRGHLISVGTARAVHVAQTTQVETTQMEQTPVSA